MNKTEGLFQFTALFEAVNHTAFANHYIVLLGHSSYSSPPKYHGEVSGGKHHDLADLFDIAITALAFLSFGMFIVHVIMCISMTVSVERIPKN